MSGWKCRGWKCRGWKCRMGGIVVLFYEWVEMSLGGNVVGGSVVLFYEWVEVSCGWKCRWVELSCHLDSCLLYKGLDKEGGRNEVGDRRATNCHHSPRLPSFFAPSFLSSFGLPLSHFSDFPLFSAAERSFSLSTAVLNWGRMKGFYYSSSIPVSHDRGPKSRNLHNLTH